MVNLPKSGPMFLAADSCYTLDNLNNNILSGLAWNFGESVKSVEKMKALQKLYGAQIVTGHDPEAWKAFKQAPKYYE